MPKREFLAGVIALSQEDPKRLLSLIREGWPEIKAAIDQGHTLKVIHQRLQKGGVPITYHCFTKYVRRVRKEFADSGHQLEKAEKAEIAAKARGGEPRPPAEHDAKTVTPELQPPPRQENSNHDPYATIRERLNRKPAGFHWDEDEPDNTSVVLNQNRKDQI